MKVVFLLLVFLLAVCYGQQPSPCDFPKQWQGGRIMTKRNSRFTEKSRLSYDEINMRIHSEDIVEQSWIEREYFYILQLFKTKKEYRLNKMTKKCNVSTIANPRLPVGVPKDAKFMFEAEIGLASVPNEHLTVVSFYGNLTEENVMFSSTVSYPSCIPISDTYDSDVIGHIENRYFDITPGIKNPAVFDIPPECASLE